MELIIIMIFIAVIFAVTIGIAVMTREDVPDVLVEEINDELETRREEIKQEKMLEEENKQ